MAKAVAATNRRAIQLFVKLLDNHTITLHTETTANVDNLKSIIEDKSKKIEVNPLFRILWNCELLTN